MTRVEDERAQQRLDEQKRIEKNLRAQAQGSNEAFKRVVSSKAQSEQKLSRGNDGRQNMSRQQQETSQKGRAASRLMAHSGIKSRDIQAELIKGMQSSTEHKRIEEKGRKDDLHDMKAQNREKQISTDNDADSKVDKQSEHLAAISRDDEQRGGGGTEGRGEGGMQGGQMGMPMNQQVSAPAEAKGAAGAPRIPQNALNEIVKRCLAGVNTKGMNEFQIDLKDGVLGGASLKVSSNGRKISTEFVTSDANIRRLIKASQQDLERAFDKSGLSLESFKVSAF